MPGNKKRRAGERKANVIRVLVAEDHTVVRDGLVAIIKQEADMDVVAETGDGQQAAELWKKHRPDITLMDLRMPGLDGVNAIYQIRAADPNARIIVLTTYDGDEDIYRGMRAGAKSYLLKDVRREELFQRTVRVIAGHPPMEPGRARDPRGCHEPGTASRLRTRLDGMPLENVAADRRRINEPSTGPALSRPASLESDFEPKREMIP